MLPRVLVERIITRDGGFCLLALHACTGEAQVAHHRANRSAGGSPILDHPANLCAACSACNQEAEDAHAITRLDLIERGLRVAKGATNEATLARARLTPVEYLDGERYFLLSADERILVGQLMKEAK